MGLRLVLAPVGTPVTLEEVKAHLRVLHTLEDALISTYIRAAVMYVEQYTSRSLLPTTWSYSQPYFTYNIRLPRFPVTAVNSITYHDGTVVQTLDNLDSVPDWRVDLYSEPAQIRPFLTWPSIDTRYGGIEVEFVAGYANAAAIPEDIRIAIFLLVGHFYSNRSNEVTGSIAGQVMATGVEELLAPYIIYY